MNAAVLAIKVSVVGVTAAAVQIRSLDQALKRNAAGLSAFIGMLSKLAAIAPAIAAVSGAIFALGAALAPLVGLAGAAAVGLSALAQAAGVVALATMGVGDALKEQIGNTSKAAKAATSSADQQRSAAKSIAAAQEGVRTAQRGVQDATRSLTNAERDRADALKALGPAQTEAKRALQDMHSSLASAALNEQGAVMRLEDARASLARAMSPVDAGRLADAQERLTDSTWNQQKAVQGLTSARQRLDDLMKPADAMSAADAEDAVADSLRGQERAALNLLQAQKDLIRVTGDPKATEQDRAEAKLAVADAENAIGDASRTSTKAQQALTKLQSPPDQKAVADAKQDIADAERNVAEAAKETAKAEKAIQEAQKGVDPAEVARATHEVAVAEQALADAKRDHARQQKDVAAAEKAGVDGSQQVVDARDRIAEANRRVTEAERDLAESQRGVAKAMRAVGDAQRDAAAGAAGLAASAADLNEKFNELPPAAQTFVRALQALKPKFDDLRATAAAGLFPGVTAGIQSAMQNFDPLQRVVGATAEAMGGLAAKAGELVGSKGFGKDLETIGGRNVLIIDRLGNAAINIGDAFRHLLVAAGPLTTWLAKVAEGWSENLLAATKAGRESGKLASFFQKTKNTLEVVGSILGNLASAFFNVGKEAAPFGRDILGTLDDVTERFADWTKSLEGQNALKKFFESSNAVMGAILPVIGNVLKDFGELAFLVLPAFLAIMEKLGPYAGPVIQVLIAMKALATVAKGLGALAAFANPIGLVVLAIAALGLAFVVAYKRSEKFREIVGQAWMYVQDTAKRAVDYVKGYLNEHQDDIQAAGLAFENLGKAAKWAFEKVLLPVVEKVLPYVQKYVENSLKMIGGAFDVIVGILTGDWARAWDGVKAIVEGAVGQVLNVLKGAGTLIFEAGKLLVELLIKGLKATPGALVDAGKWMFEQQIKGLKALPGLLMDVAKWLVATLKSALEAQAAFFINRGKDVIGWVVEGFKAQVSLITGAAKWLLDTLKEKLVALTNFFINRGQDVIGWVADGLQMAPGKITGFASWLVGVLKEKLIAGTEFFINRGQDVVGWIGQGLQTVVDSVTKFPKWLVDTLKDLLGGEKIVSGFVGLGKSIMGWIVDGMKEGAYALQGFLNKIIDIVNILPGVEIKHIDKLSKDKDGKVQGFARGGAFARTGGMVNSPITLMGEEAPRFPEFVVPTNPAYRKRAQGLAMQAAQAVGLATGGMYSQGAMESLWKKENPGVGNARLMSAVGMAESGGNAGIVGPPSGRGLWQIEWNVWADHMRKIGLTNAFDAAQNANMAEEVLRQQGINAWVAYTNGSYQKFMGGGSLIDKVTGAVSGAVSGAFDMLKDGASALLGKLPSTKGLGWLEGLGSKVLSGVKDYIKGKAAGILGSGGGGPVGDGAVSWPALDALAKSFGMSITSTRRDTATYHGQVGADGRARATDYSNSTGPTPEMMKTALAMKEQYGKALKELFYSPMGGSIKNGKWVDGMIVGGALGTPGNHYNHVHAAFAKGGMFGGLPYAGSFAGGGVVPGPVGRPMSAVVHGGETITDPRVGGSSGPLVNIEQATFSSELEVEMFARSLDWRFAR